MCLQLANKLGPLCLSSSWTRETDTPSVLEGKGQAFPCVPTFHWILVGKIGLESFQHSVSWMEIFQSCTNGRNCSLKYERLAGSFFIEHETIERSDFTHYFLTVFPTPSSCLLLGRSGFYFSFKFEETSTQRGFIHTGPEKTRLTRVLAVFSPFLSPLAYTVFLNINWNKLIFKFMLHQSINMSQGLIYLLKFGV